MGPVGGAIRIGPEAGLGAGVGPIGAGTTGRGMAVGDGVAALGIVGVRNAEDGAPIGARAVGGGAAGAAPDLYIGGAPDAELAIERSAMGGSWMRAVFLEVSAETVGCAGTIGRAGMGAVPNPAGTTAGRWGGSDGPLSRIFPPETEARTVEGKRFPAGAASPMIGGGALGSGEAGAGGASEAASKVTGPDGGRMDPNDGAATGIGPVGGFVNVGAAVAGGGWNVGPLGAPCGRRALSSSATWRNGVSIWPTSSSMI